MRNPGNGGTRAVPQLEAKAYANFYLSWIIDLENASRGLKGAEISRILEIGLAGVGESS